MKPEQPKQPHQSRKFSIFPHSTYGTNLNALWKVEWHYLKSHNKHPGVFKVTQLLCNKHTLVNLCPTYCISSYIKVTPTCFSHCTWPFSRSTCYIKVTYS